MFDTVRILDSYRKRNEDRAEAIPHGEGLVIVVADGAGGTSGGADAADTAVMWVKALLAGGGGLPSPSGWAEFLGKLDHQIACGGGGQTTAVVASVAEEGVSGASVGDSAAWIIGPGGMTDLTRDQVRKPLLGTGLARPVPFHSEALEGTLLAASDGLVKYAARDAVCRAAMERDLPAAGRRIVDLARLRSGQLQDDVSLVLCRRREEAPSRH